MMMRCALVLLLSVAIFSLGPDRASEASDWDKRLQTADPDELYSTILEIAKKRDLGAAVALVETGADTEHPHIATACGDALAQMDAKETEERLLGDPAFGKRLKALLTSKKDRRQRNLARILGAWGHPFVDEHLAYLCSKRRSEDVRIEALFMSGELPETPELPFPQTREAIAKALKSRSGAVQAAACSAAGRRKLDALKDDLAGVVRKSKHEYAGLYAVWALKQVGWENGISPFVAQASKGRRKPPGPANLKAIVELASMVDGKKLLRLSKHKNQDVRDAALLALGRLAWHASREEAPAEEPDDAKARTLPDPPIDVSDEMVDRLIDAVRADASWEVRDAARQALLRLGKRVLQRVAERMPAITRSSDEDASLTAIELCGIFRVKDAYASLEKVVRYDKDRTRHMFAACALEGVAPEKAVEDLTKGLKVRKKAKRQDLSAVRALGYIRHASAFERLLGIIGETGFSADLLREAEFALERLTGHRFGRKPARWKAWMAGVRRPFHPRLDRFDRRKNRRDAVKRKLYGLTETTEQAVATGLRWIGRQQRAIGDWDCYEELPGHFRDCEPAYTGLALLAFLGAGYSASNGKFREAIRRGSHFLAVTQFYDGSFPGPTGGTSEWYFTYLVGMATWGLVESHALSGERSLAGPAQWGIDYLVRIQAPGAGWRYTPRSDANDTSCTSWVLMATKMATLVGLDVPQRSWDGIDAWLERCHSDLAGREELPEDLSSDYDYEVGLRGGHRSHTTYGAFQQESQVPIDVSMTAVGMVSRFFMGWKRSHPLMVGSANLLLDNLPRWMSGLPEVDAWYHYYWYYGTLAMHQMGGRYWRTWNEKIRSMLPKHQDKGPRELRGSWLPSSKAWWSGGRLFSTPLAIMTLETYYRFSPLMQKQEPQKKGATSGK